MIGRDDQAEEVSYKVADRRKFNSDGSVREGVVLDEARPEPPPSPAVSPKPTAAQASEFEQAINETTGPENGAAIDDELDEEIPGAEDPASFVNFLSTPATNAADSLRAAPHPATGKRWLDREPGKYWLDVLGMIKEKTKGTLHRHE